MWNWKVWQRHCVKYPYLRKVPAQGEKTFSDVTDEEINNLSEHPRNNLHVSSFLN